jgi:hypothetical protein
MSYEPEGDSWIYEYLIKTVKFMSFSGDRFK